MWLGEMELCQGIQMWNLVADFSTHTKHWMYKYLGKRYTRIDWYFRSGEILLSYSWSEKGAQWLFKHTAISYFSVVVYSHCIIFEMHISGTSIFWKLEFVINCCAEPCTCFLLFAKKRKKDVDMSFIECKLLY